MESIIKCVAIDDEPLALDIISKFCQRIGGIELSTFSDPMLGLEMIKREKPAIAFLDIEMGNMSGLKLHPNCLRKLVSFLQPPILIMRWMDSIWMRLTIFTSPSLFRVFKRRFQKP